MRIHRIANRRCLKIVTTLGFSMLGIACAGCGPELGAWMYHAGMVPSEQVPAEYKLPAGPVLILVDDDQDLVQPSVARDMFVDSLAKQFKEHKIADHITTNEELAHVRQTEPKFEQRGAREVGRMVGADTVVWVSVKQFLLERDLEMAVSPAQWAVTLKVVNAKAEKRDEVRLWPMDREGKLIDVSVRPQELHRVKATSEVHQKMADELADKIAKVFYDYEITQDTPR